MPSPRAACLSRSKARCLVVLSILIPMLTGSLPNGIAADKPGLDRYGDRLPDQAVDRLGTRRLRHVYNVAGVAWSPNGKLLASCGVYSIRIWNGATGEPVKELKNPPLDLRSGTYGIAWSPDGTRIAASCEQGIIRLWDVETEMLISAVSGHVGSAIAVAFAPDGLVYATAGSDGFVRVWDGEAGTNILSLKCGDRVAGSFGLAFSRDGNLLAAGSHQTIRIWSLVDGGQPVKIENAHGENIVSLFFTLDGHLVSAGHSAFQRVQQPGGMPAGRVNPQLRVWDPMTGKPVREVALENCQGGLCMCTCGVSEDGRIAAVVLPDSLEFRDARTWQRLFVADDYRSIDSQPPRSVAVSPDGTRLALTGGRNAVHIRDVSTGKRVLAFPDSHEDYLVDVAASSDGLVAVTGCNDGTVAIRSFDRQTPTTLIKLAEEPDARVTSVGVSLDGKLVAACGWSLNPQRTAIVGHLKLWSRSGGDVLLSQSTGDRIMALAFSPDSSRIAVAQGQGSNNPRRSRERDHRQPG